MRDVTKIQGKRKREVGTQRVSVSRRLDLQVHADLQL